MTYLQLQNLFYELTKTNSTSVPVETLNLYTQPAEDRVASLILQSDGRWQWDDQNNADFPIATTTLVSGQQDYSLSTAHLKLLGAAVKDNIGNYRRLLPFDADDLESTYGPLMDRSRFLTTNGMPLYYDVIANSFVLYPAPDNGISVTLAAGLKLYYQRGPLHFDYSTGKFTDATGSTSSSPGFNSLYHDLIAYIAAYSYCVANIPTLASGYLVEVQRKEAALIHDYSKRDKDERSNLMMKSIRHR